MCHSNDGDCRDRLNDEIMTFLADAQDLPFEDAEYDQILANLNLILFQTDRCGSRGLSSASTRRHHCLYRLGTP